MHVRAGRQVRGAGGVAAGQRPARPARHLPVLRHAGADDPFINGLQWSGYKTLRLGRGRRIACADSWGRALATGKASLSIPCFAERRYGGVLDDEMLMALPPDDLPKAIAGMEALAKNGLRYPFPQYGIQNDARAGLGASYPAKTG